MRILRIFILICLAVGFLAVNLIVFQVEATEAAVVTQFGETVRVITDPGLYYKLPDPFQSVVKINAQLQVYNLPQTEFLTSDKKNIVLEAYATWQVVDALLFLQTVRNPANAQTRLADIINSETGSAVGQVGLAQLVSTDTTQVRLEETLTSITEGAAARTAAFGFTVTDVRFKELTFPEANLTSVFQRMRSEREAIARQLRSEGTEQAALIRAGADTEAAQIKADANEQAATIRGEADANAINIYAEAFGQDRAFYQFVRTLQSYSAFIDENTTLILPADSALLAYLNPAEISLTTPSEPDVVTADPTMTVARAAQEPVLTPSTPVPGGQP